LAAHLFHKRVISEEARPAGQRQCAAIVKSVTQTALAAEAPGCPKSEGAAAISTLSARRHRFPPMAAVPFDTLKLARRLESAGFPPKQAGDTAEALADAMSGAELATKADLATVQAALKRDIAAVEAALKTDVAGVKADLAAVEAALKRDIVAVEAGLKAEIAAVRTGLKAEIAAVRTGLTAEIAAVRTGLKAEIELLRRDLTIRLGSMIVVAVGILLAAIRYLPNPHS
jgi:hypothetical protein